MSLVDGGIHGTNFFVATNITSKICSKRFVQYILFLSLLHNHQGYCAGITIKKICSYGLVAHHFCSKRFVQYILFLSLLHNHQGYCVDITINNQNHRLTVVLHVFLHYYFDISFSNSSVFESWYRELLLTYNFRAMPFFERHSSFTLLEVDPHIMIGENSVVSC